MKAAEHPEKGPAKAVHAARTGCKKVRALLRLVEPAFPGRQRENAALRNAAASLAGARDASVMRQTLRRLQKGAEVPVQAAIERTLTAIEAAAPVDSTAAALDRFLDVAAPIRKRAARWQLRFEGFEVVAESAARIYRCTRKAMNRAAQCRGDEDFHAWRKRAKYHWYHLQLLRGLDASACDHLKATERLGAMLGKHHDLAVLVAFLAASPPDDAGDRRRILEAIEDEQEKLAGRCFRAGERIFSLPASKWRAALARDLRRAAASIPQIA